jgi:hypothetical protein
MLAGDKPLAMFTEYATDSSVIPEKIFAQYIENGTIVMREIFELVKNCSDPHDELHVRRVLYALPDEAWRLDAMLLLCEIYRKQGGWDEGLERMTGRLLGYEDEDIETFLEMLRSKRSNH